MGRGYQYARELVVYDPPNGMRVESTSGRFRPRMSSSSSAETAGLTCKPRIGRPTGLTHLSQPIISLTKHENLDPGYARLERALDTATSSEAG